ncbi:hypothetical protein HDC90_001103 [Pedobacter sp. AK013]|uniref:hypothetical protein n=1 Tax=Pedobacter sp. AK013 TaxID=2723071 RepID=UPI001615C2FC|nr:hypothetical protein [Pedobacter sp. AK013]MBB6236491.1 hypothetical protein [Pedobacter sp. AK013]
MNIVIEENLAIVEVSEFVNQFKIKPCEEQEVKDLYPEVILAVQFGLMVLKTKEKPEFKLKEPVKNLENEVSLDSVSFKTRIVASEQRKLSAGLDLKKEPLLFGHKCMAYIIGQPLIMLDKFCPFDYKVIEQMSTLFL